MRDQVSESTAAGGGSRETEKKKNKEYHEASQASETTIFFLVDMGSRPLSCFFTPTFKILIDF